jgi:zinc transport system substrate-binding protein
MYKVKTPSLATIFLVMIFVITALILFLPEQKKKAENETNATKPIVASTIQPVYDIVRSVAGDTIKTVLILPPGSSPHTFEPAPSQLNELKDAKIIFAIGHGLDQWISELATINDTDTLELSQGIKILEAEEDGHEHEEDGHEHEEDGHEHEEDGHEHGPTDPHYWLDPGNIKIMADNVYRELARRWPDSADSFKANLSAYKAEIDKADNEAKGLLSLLENRNIITLHGAWRYFARSYNLNLTGSFEPSPGREPTPKYLADLYESVETAGIRVIYSEPQLATSGLESFLSDNDLNLAILDPLGGVPGRETLAELIVYNAQTISQNQ